MAGRRLRKTLSFDPARQREEEMLIESVRVKLIELRNAEGVSNAELAGRLGVTRGYITQLLSGTNVTLKTLNDTLYALGYRAVLSFESLEEEP